MSDRRWTCEACGHEAVEPDVLGVPIGPTSNVVIVACGPCRRRYAATGEISLMHATPVLIDLDVTDELIGLGKVDELGRWPATGGRAT